MTVGSPRAQGTAGAAASPGTAALGAGPSGLGTEPSALGTAGAARPLGSAPAAPALEAGEEPYGSESRREAPETSGAAGAAVPSDREAGAVPDEVEPSARYARAEPEAASLWAALRDVNDPEFPISVVDLGLVYDIRRTGARVEVDLTFTATACPCMDFIREDVRDRLLKEPGVEEVEVRVVWDPPWTVDRMTEEGRAALRRLGVAA